MKPFSRLVCFESAAAGGGKQKYFADLGVDTTTVPSAGASLSAYPSFLDLLERKNQVTATVGKVRTTLSAATLVWT